MGIQISAPGSTLGDDIGASELATAAITGQTAETSADNADLLLIYDNSAGALRKMTRANFTSGVGNTYTALTAGDLTVTNDGSNGKPFVATWSVANVTGLGAVADGTLVAATLPAKTYVRNAYLIIRTPDDTGESGLSTLTASLGRTGAAYEDIIAAASVTDVGANTIYGNVSGERGANLTGYDFSSFTATTSVVLRFVATGGTLNAVATNSGTVVIDYMVIP